MKSQYPHVFEEAVLENVKAWVMDDTNRSLCEASHLKLDLRERVSDHEMLKTYSTGLLAMSLIGYVTNRLLHFMSL